MTQKVGILAGGWNVEREVSLTSSLKSQEALQNQGYETVIIDVGENLIELLQTIQKENINTIFNGLHGRIGEDGAVQGVLEYIRLPYTHSGVLASSISMDKQIAKSLLQNRDILMPKGDCVNVTEFADYTPTFEGPYVLKPNTSGSSCGVHLEAKKDLSRKKIITYAKQFQADPDIYGHQILVEEFIPGLELTVAVLDDQPLTVTNIISHKGDFYNYASKYETGGLTHQIPAEIPQHVFDRAMENAKEIHDHIGAHYISRSDFRYNPEKDELHFLEINLQPGLTPTSLVPKQANYKGISFDEIIVGLVKHATCHLDT